MPNLPKMYTAAEAADALRCTRTTIHNLIRRGELDGVMVGGRWLVYASSVEDRISPPREH